MRQIFSNSVHVLAIFSLNFLLMFIPLGCVATLIIGVIYTNSANYCRDCNTGIGIVLVGFILSLMITLVVAWIIGSPFDHGNAVDSSSQ